MKKKGLVIIYDPHALMQFLQFYCMNDFPAEWDALCLPKSNGKEEMHEYCERSGIFTKIYTNNTEFQALSLFARLVLFLKMFAFALIGQRKYCCKKILNTLVDDIDKYEYFAANTESGFVAGLLASFGKEKTVVYFEDGSPDYLITRKKYKTIYPQWTFVTFQCVVMAFLGYFGKGYTYLHDTKYCYKYASIPHELAYKNYKEIRAFRLNAQAKKKYESLLAIMYPELKYLPLNEYNALIFTDPVDELVGDSSFFIIQCLKYISEKHYRALLKRHPRDKIQYNSTDKLALFEISKEIPAEVLLPFLVNCDCYFFEFNSIMINMRGADVKAKVLFSEDIYIRKARKMPAKLDYLQTKTYCNRFLGGICEVIKIDAEFKK